MKIRINDTVEVSAGRDRGKRGTVQQALPKDQRIVVEGVNFVKRHTRPNPRVRQAGIIQREAPIHVSNVMLVCPHCNRGVRVGFTHLTAPTGTTKVRVCKKCHEVIDQAR